MPKGKKSIIKGNVVFLGDQKSGKTSIIRHLLNQPFTEDYDFTVGMDFKYLAINSSDQNSEEQIAIWDSTGMVGYHPIVEGMMKALSKRNPIDIVIITIAANQPYKDKIKQYEYWKKFADPCSQIIVLETKNDLQGSYIPFHIDAFKKQKNQLAYFSTSAKNKSKIDAVSNEIIKTIRDKSLAQKTLKLTQNVDAITKHQPSLFSSLFCCLPFFSSQKKQNFDQSIQASKADNMSSSNNINDFNAEQLKVILLKLREKLKTGALDNIFNPYEVSLFCNNYYNYQDDNGIKHRINVPKNVFDALMTIQASLQMLKEENQVTSVKHNIYKIMGNFYNASQSFSLTRSDSTRHFYSQIPVFLNEAITQSTVAEKNNGVNLATTNTQYIAAK